jgi:hypothetical protein
MTCVLIRDPQPGAGGLRLSSTTWEAEIGRITVQGQPAKIVCETPVSKITQAAECWWLTSVILATQEAEIRRIEV